MDQRHSFRPFGKHTNLVYGVSIIIIAAVLALVVHDMSEAGIFDLPGGVDSVTDSQ